MYRELLDWIRSGRLAPGSRVREDEIGSLLGVSRTPVREALTKLQARGLLEPTAGGLVVTAITRSQIMELYALRAMLEGAAARFAAENASSGDLASLRHAHALFVESEGDANGAARSNTIFHQVIHESAHNRYLVRMLEDLNDSLALVPSTTFTVMERPAAARVEHADILAAIEARDPDEAEAAARQHIDQARETRLTMLFTSDPRSL